MKALLAGRVFFLCFVIKSNEDYLCMYNWSLSHLLLASCNLIACAFIVKQMSKAGPAGPFNVTIST